MPQLLLFEEPRRSGMRKSGKKTVLILHAAYLHTCKYHNRAKKKQFSLCLNVHRAQQSSECQFYGDYNLNTFAFCKIRTKIFGSLPLLVWFPDISGVEIKPYIFPCSISFLIVFIIIIITIIFKYQTPNLLNQRIFWLCHRDTFEEKKKRKKTDKRFTTNPRKDLSLNILGFLVLA